MEAPKLPTLERQALVERLSTDPVFSHGVYGCFPEKIAGGHFFQESRGRSALPSKILRNEEFYIHTFESWRRRLPNPPQPRWFGARVVEKHTEENEVLFVLSFPDYKGDDRPGSHTDYMLVIPGNEAPRLTSLIENDPSILIDVFRKVYPEYDRSEGRLVIDPNCPAVLRMPSN